MNKSLYKKSDLLFFRQASNLNNSGIIVLQDNESSRNTPLFIEILTGKEFSSLKDAVNHHKEYHMSKTECLKRVYTIYISKNGEMDVEYQIWRDNPPLVKVKIEKIIDVFEIQEVGDIAILNFNVFWTKTKENTLLDYAKSIYKKEIKQRKISDTWLLEYVQYCLSTYRNQEYLSMHNIYFVDSFSNWLKKKEGVMA